MQCAFVKHLRCGSIALTHSTVFNLSHIYILQKAFTWYNRIWFGCFVLCFAISSCFCYFLLSFFSRSLFDSLRRLVVPLNRSVRFIIERLVLCIDFDFAKATARTTKHRRERKKMQAKERANESALVVIEMKTIWMGKNTPIDLFIMFVLYRSTWFTSHPNVNSEQNTQIRYIP